MDFFRWLLDTSNYPPRWYCGQWSSALGWLHILSDLAIFCAYFMIPCLLMYFIRKRRDVPLTPIVWLFASFILCCGIGHLVEAGIFWFPAYHLSGMLKLTTAVVSLGTVMVLIKVIPLALTLPGLAKLNIQLAEEIEERKRTEAALQASLADVADARATLEERNVSLALMNERLSQASLAAADATRSKSEFLANMSHEIRTPMTAILGYAEVLAEQRGENDELDAANTIRRNGKYLLDIINDILDLSKIEAGRFEVEQIACSPRQIVADVATLMQVRADAKGLLLEVEYQDPLPSVVHTDPTRLRQCLVNLVGNAIKFTETGRVRLVVTQDQSRLRFDIIDSGIGMTPEVIACLFRPFSQADTSTARRFGGTGLGLTITKRLAEMLGGAIEVHSTPEVGSRFTLTVEAGRANIAETNAAPATSRTPDEPASAAGSLSGGRRVLLAEDGPDNRRLLASMLRLAGLDVKVVENGALAVRHALTAEPAYDVILMDMQMPVLDGYRATSLLRAHGYSGAIVALTAHAMVGDREKCLAVGCTDYTTKPIEREELLRVVARQLTRAEPVAAPR
ncbi:MAG TPA: ATP-binding protein [Pirellulaceae bacterium]|nr:ATP-binding protein [Pirellulaceae bacterium]